MQKFSLVDIAKKVDTTDGLIVGAGAGPWYKIGVNSELMANVSLKDRNPTIKSAIAYLDCDNGKKDSLKFIDTDEFALMANLYMCDGKPGQVKYHFVTLLYHLICSQPPIHKLANCLLTVGV